MSLKVRVDNVFHINGVEVISPRMENLEALVANVLISVSFDVGLEEFIGGGVCADRVAQIILRNWLLLSKE